MCDQVVLFKEALERFGKSKKQRELYSKFRETMEQCGWKHPNTVAAQYLMFDAGVAFSLRAVSLISRWRAPPQVMVNGVCCPGDMEDGELRMELTVRNQKAVTYLPRSLWLLWGGRAGWIKSLSADAIKARLTARGELDLEAAPIRNRYDKLMAIAGTVVELAEDGVLGEMFESCDAECECFVCECRAVLAWESK